MTEPENKQIIKMLNKKITKMETKSNSVNGRSVKKSETTKTEEKKETKTVDLALVKNLQSENQELKENLDRVLKQLENRPQSIEEQIQYFETKKLKINHLRQFEETKKDLVEGLKTLNSDKEKGVFSNENFKLIFGRSGYQGKIENSIFKISNTELLIKTVGFIVEQIDNKIVELEKAIQC